MPVGAFVPSRIHLDYPEWQAPLIGNVGQVWAYDGTGYVPTSFLLSSAVSVYGLTLASAADAAAARTALALGTAAVLNVGTGANQIVQLDGSARLPAVDGSQLTGISGGSVAGSNTQVIINDGGVYAGDPGLTYAKATDRLTVVGGIVAGDWSPPSDSTTAVSIWNAARSARVVTVDTTNRRLSVTSLSNHVRLIYTSDTTKYCSFSANSAGTLSISATSGQVEYYDGTNSYFFRVFAANNENVRVHSNGTSWLAGGNIGIGQSSGITALLDLAASTTARASLRVRAGTAPTTPNDGDIWYATGDRLKFYRAATETIASGVPGTGGAATATGTWGATEMAMLQAVYDIARSFGMLS